MQIIDIPSPNHWNGRLGAVPGWIILHGTAGFTTAQQVGDFFAQASSQVSANYVIGRDGVVVRCVNEGDAPYANGAITGPSGNGGDGIHHDAWWDGVAQWNGVANPNLVTISIEHVKPSTDNSDQLTNAQKAASFALIKEICQRWNIPMRYADASGGITGHYSMDPVNRSRCPGPYPWDELWTALKSNGDESMYTELQISDMGGEASDIGNGQWKFKNGIVLGGAHLNYFRWNGGIAQFGLPGTNEIQKDKAKHPEVTEVIFERSLNRFDPNYVYDHPWIDKDQPEKRVYRAHIESGDGLALLMQHAGVAPAQVTQASIDQAVHTVDAIIAAAQNIKVDLVTK